MVPTIYRNFDYFYRALPRVRGFAAHSLRYSTCRVYFEFYQMTSLFSYNTASLSLS